jgi:ATP-binding cassette subfamily F protein 3
VWHHRVEATLLGVGLPRIVWEQKITTLSGGQRSRLALAKILIAEPELLLLDEPTNHLDLAAIEWLENYLESFKGAVVLISHDRFLLDRLATRIVWLTQGKIKSFPGNYSAFVEQRELLELTQARQYEEQQKDIEKQKEFIRRFGAGQRSKEAKGREKRLERLLVSDQMVARVENQKEINLRLNTDQRAGDRVLSVKELSKRYGENELWKDLKFEVRRGERIGIIGPNGSGKTTMLRVLLGNETADRGDLRWGANLKIGYYDQRLDQFDESKTVFEQVSNGRTNKPQEIKDHLGMMLIRGVDVEKQMGMLSGGERARVRLVELLLDKPNVLVLDEPTNHLDIASCEALEGALQGFQGTIVCVSHDRYFLDKTIGRLMVLDPPGMADFDGNYSAWAGKQREREAAARRENEAREKAKKSGSSKGSGGGALKQPQKKAGASSNKDNPYLRPFGKLGLKELERAITETEIAIGERQAAFGEGDSFKDPGRGKRLQREYEELKKKLEQLEAEYFAREQK